LLRGPTLLETLAGSSFRLFGYSFESPFESLTLTLSQRARAFGEPIKNPKSKIQNDSCLHLFLQLS
jgi:hypothetical protein